MKTKESNDDKESITSSLARGLQVLECFGPQSQSYTLSELAKQLDIPKSSMLRVLKTLSQMDYLRYEEHSKHYYLGVRVLSLGFALLQSLELREIARPYMENLSRECNKTLNLAILNKDEMVYVERIRVQGIRSYNISIGYRTPPWNTAIGKAVLAYLEPKKVIEMLKRAKDKGSFQGDGTKLMKVLAETRKNGFALDNQEFLRGILAIAVPIFSSTGVVGAINLVGEPEDVSPETLRKEYAPKLMKVCMQMSEALGYRKQG